MSSKKKAVCEHEGVCDKNGFYTEGSVEVMCYQHKHESCPKVSKLFEDLLKKK